MRWAPKAEDRWRRRFAFFPVLIGDQWVWLEWFEKRPMGIYDQVRLIEDGQPMKSPNSRDEREAELFACPNCNGMGKVRGPEHGMPWYTCRKCEGIGVVDKNDDPVSEEAARKAGML
jgi:hypothetical protein